MDLRKRLHKADNLDISERRGRHAYQPYESLDLKKAIKSMAAVLISMLGFRIILQCWTEQHLAQTIMASVS